MITAEQLEDISRKNNSQLSGMLSKKEAYEKLLQNEEIQKYLKDIEEKILEKVSVSSSTLSYKFPKNDYEFNSSLFDIIRNHGYKIVFSVDYETPGWPRDGFNISWSEL